LKVAIIVEAAGSPHSLAMTSFVGSLAEGFEHNDVQTRVVGLATSPAYWLPDALGSVDSSAPWLSAPNPRLRDAMEALRAGVLDPLTCSQTGRASLSDDWYRELLLERELSGFMGGARGVVLAYPRVFSMLSPVVRTAHRHGWAVVVFATEALTDRQIDPATRADYIQCVVECCQGVWAVSDYLSDFWRAQGVQEAHILRSLPPVRHSFFLFHCAPPRSSSAVFVGNLGHRDVEYLLEIADSVITRVPSFNLTIYGDALESRHQALQATIARQGLSSVITLRPAVAPVDLPGVLKGADVLLLPRAAGEFSEAGFPNKLGEYLASGRPVVVTAVGDIPRYLTDGVSAALVVPDDIQSFADAVVEVLVDQDLGDRLGAAGREVAERWSKAEKIASRALVKLESLDRPAAWRSPSGFSTALWLQRTLAMWRALLPDLKRAAVRMLRLVHLKPPAPASESQS